MTAFPVSLRCGCWCQPVAGRPTAPLRALARALLLCLSLALCEAIASRLSHSLALRAEASHLSADAIALGLALGAAWLARCRARQPTASQRLEAAAALFNGLGLGLMAGAIAWEALRHLHAPPAEILSGPMLLTALVSLAVNGVNIALLARASRDNLNLRGALLHVAADAATALSTAIAALAIWLWHWHWVDAALGLVVASLMAASALPLVRQSWQAWRSPAPARYLSAAGFHQLGATDLAALVGAPANPSR